jgi:iron complex outermembrane receptor protein
MPKFEIAALRFFVPVSVKCRPSPFLRTVSFFFFAASFHLNAQDASPTPSPGDSQTLSQVIVTATVPIEDTVLPTIKPTDAATGLEQNILDTPRSVSVLSKAMMDARQIIDVTDVGQYASGTYTPSIFGASGVPYIRGLYAELYQNGQRLQFYSNSMPPSFNGVESLDIVKGPGSPVFGPSNVGVGGYVNLDTKKPFFDRWHVTTTMTIGDFVGGGQSYLRPEWQLDVGGPLIKDKLAIRFSYLGREADSYYDNVKDHTQDIFAAITYMPTPALTFDYTAQYYEARFAENNGINRVTQNLIDNGLYTQGPFTVYPAGAPPWSGYVAGNPNGTFNTTKLHNSTVLVGPGDSAYGKRFTTQLISKAQISDSFQIVERTLFEDTSSRKIDTLGFSEWAPVNDIFDTRLELHYDFHLFGGGNTTATVKEGKQLVATNEENSGILNSIVAGASYRHEEHRNYNDPSLEPFTVYDLSTPGGWVQFPKSVVFGGRLIPGGNGYTALPSGYTYEERSNDFGFFLQDTIKFNEWLSVYGGIRFDYVSAKSRIPQLGTYLDGTGGTQQATPYRSRNSFNPSYFGSLVIKPQPWLTTYVTYNKTNAIQGDQNWGGILANFTTQQLANETDLYEAGAKVTLLQNTLFASISTYYETYTEYDIRNVPYGQRSKGIELEANYQPNKNFNASANLTFSNTNYTGVTASNSIFVETNNYLNVFGPKFVDVNGGRGNGGTNTTTGFSPNYTGVYTGSSSPTTAGVPPLLFNAYMTYQLDCGLGFSVGPQVTGATYENPQKTLKIPAQVTWNAAIFYKQKSYEIQLNFFNFTDERNYTPVQNFASNDTIFPDEPFHMNLTVKLKF